MPRKARQLSKTGIYHIVARGVNKQTIFGEAADKAYFLRLIKNYQEKSGYIVYGYCLMDNHFHLLIRERNEPISLFIQRISSSYVYFYNMKYERSGHLFQARFHSEPVENRSYFISVLRYIHQNPVKANLAQNVFQCDWTSMDEYVRKSTFVDISTAMRLFSADKQEALRLFKQYMQQRNDDECLDIVKKLRLSDDDVKEHLKEIGIASTSTLQLLPKTERNKIIRQLKLLDGTSIRQIARVTGLSKKVVEQAWKR